MKDESDNSFRLFLFSLPKSVNRKLFMINKNLSALNKQAHFIYRAKKSIHLIEKNKNNPLPFFQMQYHQPKVIVKYIPKVNHNIIPFR